MKSSKIDIYVFERFSKSSDVLFGKNQVCGITLTDNVIDIVFHVFDSNRDGHLSTDEFLRVLHKRERDIAQPVESGFLEVLSCCFNYGNDLTLRWLFG